MSSASRRRTRTQPRWRQRIIVGFSALALIVTGLSAPASFASAGTLKPKPVATATATATAKKLEAQQARAQILARKPPRLPDAIGSASRKPAGRAPKAVIQNPKATSMGKPPTGVSQHHLPTYLANVPKAAQRWSTMRPQTVTSTSVAKSGPTSGGLTSRSLPLGQGKQTALFPVQQTAVLSASPTAAAAASTGSITGSITDAATHSPIGGACAIASSYIDNASYTACSDATGAYAIVGIPAGSYDMSFEDHVHSHLLGWSTGQAIVTAGATTTGINGALSQGGSIAGTISASGSPLVGACATVVDLNGNYINAGGCTDSSGHFQTIGVVPGSYKVVFDDQAAGSYMGQWYNGVATQAAASLIAVTLNIVTPNINATLARGGSVSGTVTDAASHSLLANICVDVYGVTPDVGYVATRCTGADGTYTSPGLPSGIYTVEFRDGGGTGHLGQWLGDKADEASATRLSVSLGTDTPGADAALVLGGSITGAVTDASTAAPVNGACVLADLHGTASVSGYACSDATGHYTVNGLPTGSFDLDFDGRRVGYLGRWYKDQTDATLSTPVAVTVSAITPGINQSLPLGGSITGTVTDAVTHAAIANECPMAFDKSTTYYGTCGTVAGTYTIIGLPTGSYQVQFAAWSSKYLPQWWDNKPDQQSANPVAVTAGARKANVDAALQAGGTITGTVTDAVTHAGIANVCPQALLSATGNTYSSDLCSSADGSYTITGMPTGSYQVVFPDWTNTYIQQWWNDKPDQQSANLLAVTAGVNTANVNAALKTGGTITGTITDAVTHAAAANVCPKAVLNTVTYYADSCGTGDGSYTITGLPTGSYQVQFAGGWSSTYLTQWWNNKPDQQSANPVAVTAGSQTANIDAAMAHAGSLSGAITAAPGADRTQFCAVAYAASDFHSSVGRGCADAAGHYTITGLVTGQYLVDFTDSGRTHVGQWYNNKPDPQSADLIRVNTGLDTPNVDAVLRQGGWATGTVTDAVTHSPLAGVCVNIFDPASFSYVGYYSTCTNSAGVYHTVGLPAGDYQVAFDLSGYGEQWWNNKPSQATADLVHITVGQATSAIDAALQPGAASISGKITDGSTGLPIVGACVSLLDAVNDFPVSQSGCSDSTGAYQTTAVSGGSYKVQFLAPYGSQYISQMYNDKPDYASSDVVTLTAGVPATGIDAALQTGGTISGAVTDSVTGDPVAGVCVYGSPQFSYPGSASVACTDASGQYQTTGEPAGQYSVQFSDFGGGPYLDQYYNGHTSPDAQADLVTVTLGADLSNIDAPMVKGATFSGTITDVSTGAPISNVCVIPQPTGGVVYYSWAGPKCSDSAGHYSTQGVVSGTYKLDFTNPNGRYVEQWWNNKPDQSSAGSLPASLGVNTPNINAAMQLGGAVGGTVTEAAGGTPLANICVTLYHPGDGSFAGNGGCTDSQGHYASAAVVAGSYKVGFADSSQNHASQYYNNKPDLPSANPVAVAAGATTAGINAALAVAVTSAGFTGMTPVRVLDTRIGTGAPKAKLGAWQALTLTVPDLPAGATAVALNVTVTGPTLAGNLLVYPGGQPRPLASNLNFSAGQTVPNMVLVPLGPGNTVTFYADSASTDLIADVLGYYAPGTGGGFTGRTPVRVLDTRSGVGAPKAQLGANQAMTLAIPGLPAGATAVALNVTVTGPTSAGNLLVYPAGQPRPLASNLNFVADLTVPNMVLVPLGPGNTVTFYADSSATDLVADVLGSFAPGTGAGFTGISPARVLDTRIGLGAPKVKLGANQAMTLTIPGLPAGTTAVALNVTVTGPTSAGNLLVYPGGQGRPLASNLNFVTGQDVPNMVLVAVGPGNTVTFYADSASTDLITDVLGYYN